MARRSRSEFAPGHIRIDRDRVCLEDAPASSHSRLTPYGSLDCAIFWRLSVSAGLISSSKRSRPRCECWQGKPTPCTSVSSQAKRQRVDHLPRHPSIFLGPFGSRPSADPATFWNLLFLAERPSAPSRVDDFGPGECPRVARCAGGGGPKVWVRDSLSILILQFPCPHHVLRPRDRYRTIAQLFLIGVLPEPVHAALSDAEISTITHFARVPGKELPQEAPSNPVPVCPPPALADLHDAHPHPGFTMRQHSAHLENSLRCAERHPIVWVPRCGIFPDRGRPIQSNFQFFAKGYCAGKIKRVSACAQQYRVVYIDRRMSAACGCPECANEP